MTTRTIINFEARPHGKRPSGALLVVRDDGSAVLYCGQRITGGTSLDSEVGARYEDDPGSDGSSYKHEWIWPEEFPSEAAARAHAVEHLRTSTALEAKVEAARTARDLKRRADEEARRAEAEEAVRTLATDAAYVVRQASQLIYLNDGDEKDVIERHLRRGDPTWRYETTPIYHAHDMERYCRWLVKQRGADAAVIAEARAAYAAAQDERRADEAATRRAQDQKWSDYYASPKYAAAMEEEKIRLAEEAAAYTVRLRAAEAAAAAAARP